MKKVEIILKPSINLEMYGLDDDYNDEALLFEQGYDMDYIEVLAGEEFEIEEHFESGTLDCKGEMITVIYNDEYSLPYVSNEDIVFERGKYMFHEDGVTFEKLED